MFEDLLIRDPQNTIPLAVVRIILVTRALLFAVLRSRGVWEISIVIRLWSRWWWRRRRLHSRHMRIREMARHVRDLWRRVWSKRIRRVVIVTLWIIRVDGVSGLQWHRVIAATAHRSELRPATQLGILGAFRGLAGDESATTTSAVVQVVARDGCSGWAGETYGF